MSLMPVLTYHYSQFLKEQENIKSKNEQKIQEALEILNKLLEEGLVIKTNDGWSAI